MKGSEFLGTFLAHVTSYTRKENGYGQPCIDVFLAVEDGGPTPITIMRERRLYWHGFIGRNATRRELRAMGMTETDDFTGLGKGAPFCVDVVAVRCSPEETHDDAIEAWRVFVHNARGAAKVNVSWSMPSGKKHTKAHATCLCVQCTEARASLSYDPSFAMALCGAALPVLQVENWKQKQCERCVAIIAVRQQLLGECWATEPIIVGAHV